MEIETMISRQTEIAAELQRIGTNFSKDSGHRKMPEYLKIRLDALDNLWREFEHNHTHIDVLEIKSHRYFQESFYQQVKTLYHEVRNKILTHKPYTPSDIGGSSSGSGIEEQGTVSKIKELLSFQSTNFRALNRLINSIDVNEISEKWELEDELRNIQSRWNDIDKLHLEIDNILEGGDEVYLDEFNSHEKSFKKMKKALHKKLSATSHVQQSTPLLEIPIFTGKYTQWPTFFDLFTESIHSNKFLSKAQKMQHLKGRVKGEAERLIQHLNISSENYDIAWEILTHRYNNPQVLFTTQI